MFLIIVMARWYFFEIRRVVVVMVAYSAFCRTEDTIGIGISETFTS